MDVAVKFRDFQVKSIITQASKHEMNISWGKNSQPNQSSYMNAK